ncbi:MAG: sodium:proton antiporter [Coriobacteriia bacterium]|nr:sodium:proton antiporter [Coriobacteriia bacterium]
MAAFQALLLLLAAILLSSIINQFLPRFSVPIIQLALGVVIALIFPHFDIRFEPEMLMLVLIAPLLFNEARHADRRALWRLKWPILGMAVGLVVIETLALGALLNYLVAGLSLAGAFALAAALSPTDSVAVSALGERARIPGISEQLLTGEALINDASGIIAFQFALAAAISAAGHFSALTATQHFLFVFLGGLIVGALFGVGRALLSAWVRSIGLEDITFHIIIELLTPFLAFLIAEALGVSGILAVVAAGFGVSFRSRRRTTPDSARQRLVSASIWSVISFILNGLVFLLLGTELPAALRAIRVDNAHGTVELLGYILAATLALYVLRALWVVLLVGLRSVVQRIHDRRLRGHSVSDESSESGDETKNSPATQPSSPVIVRTAAARSTDSIAQSTQESGTLDPATNAQDDRVGGAQDDRVGGVRDSRKHRDLSELLALTFAGARGAVALGVALTIPVLIAPGKLFPERSLIIFVAAGVIVLTMLVANFLLPLVAPAEEREASAEEVVAITKILQEVIFKLRTEQTATSHLATEMVVRSYQTRIQALEDRASFAAINQVRLQALDWEEEHTAQMADAGAISPQLQALTIQQIKRSRAFVTGRIGHDWLSSIINLLLQRTHVAQQKAHEDQELKRIENSPGHARSATKDRITVARENRELRRTNYYYAAEHLEALLTTDSAANTSVKAVLDEYRRRIEQLEGVQTRLTDQALSDELHKGAARLASRSAQEHDPQQARIKHEGRDGDLRSNIEQEVARITARGLDLEREAINQAADDELLSRSTAKELRDNIAFMELDLAES